MRIINVLKYLSLVIGGLLTPFLLLLIPYSLAFILLAYSLGRYSNGASGPTARNIVIACLAFAVNAYCGWTWYSIDEIFGNDSSNVGEIIGVVAFSVIALSSSAALLLRPKTRWR